MKEEEKRPFGPYSTDERDAASYVLPDPLAKPDGVRVASAAEWSGFQRRRILDLLKKYEYGEIVPRPDRLEFQLISCKKGALGGKALRKEVRITAAMADGRTHSFLVLVYIPAEHSGPVPAFAGLNFMGNHNTTVEEDVIPTGFRFPGVLVKPERALQHHRWVPETLVERGYASATACYHDVFPDRAGGAPDSALRLFCDTEKGDPTGVKYSVIGAWAWGLSRILDYLESDPDVDGARVAVHGHSRLGKTSLWAGAADERFKMVISNCSGCGGGALHRRKFGENLSQHFKSHLDLGYPNWFMNETEKFIWREEDLPIDQHELLAMAAPRPLAIGTATEDLAADPKGEFLACKAASEVYRLFGSEGLPAGTMPAPDVNVSGDISFHCHTGKHDHTPQDWAHYLDLADRFL